MSDEIGLPRPAHVTPPGIQHHICEHAGCGKNAGWGFARPHWFCFEHRADGEHFL
ncbi:hypothetical protein ACVILI_005655 [Mesorhizobium sp. USDA 4775]|uniref:hypothetical protein n=1 Tax=Mesorhizobium jarvisii TaxID=1777867 RepID=UPI001F0AAA2F|nr:hypothetical protein [Mesorhizobium jarvisii]MCH4559132.1 hypothetical protein [Mesorhizobium jarvisii]